MTTLHEESLTLACHPTAPGAARRLARRLAPPATVDVVELLVSELVTNAVVHAHSAVEVTISTRSDGVRLEVRDTSSHLPEIVDIGVDLHGRGLQLVQALAAGWGSERTPTGKTVWCEVSPALAGRPAGRSA